MKYLNNIYSLNAPYLVYLRDMLFKYLNNITLITYNNLWNYNYNLILLKLKENKIYNTIKILKNHQNFIYNSITDIICLDYPNKSKRYELNYFLISYLLNHRICLKISFLEETLIDSITSLFKGANWLERECWDLMGIFFSNHQDLRRILTDYGFKDFPLRKDFPCFGYVELKYNDYYNKLIFVPTELSQELRIFNFKSPWENTK